MILPIEKLPIRKLKRHRLAVPLTEEEYKAIIKMSRDLGTSSVEVCRAIIENYLTTAQRDEV